LGKFTFIIGGAYCVATCSVVGLGAALCAIGMTRILLWHEVSGPMVIYLHGWRSLWAPVLIGVVLFGTLIGAMLPLFLRACHLDPASASVPAVATVVDVSGLIIYFP
jgi:magnesium transporter